MWFAIILCQLTGASLVRRHTNFHVGAEVMVATPFTTETSIELQPGTRGVVVEAREGGAGIEFATPEGALTAWVPKADLRHVKALAPADDYKDGERVKLSDGRTGTVVVQPNGRAGTVGVKVDGVEDDPDDPEPPLQVELKHLRRAPGAASTPFAAGASVVVVEDFDAYDAFNVAAKSPDQALLNGDEGVVKAVGRSRGAMTGAFVEFPWLQTIEVETGEHDVEVQLEPDKEGRWTITALVGSGPTLHRGWYTHNGQRVATTHLDFGHQGSLEKGQIVQSWTPVNANGFAQADLATIDLRAGGRLVAAVRAGRDANMIFVPREDFSKLMDLN